MHTTTCKDNLLNDCRIPLLFWWQNTAHSSQQASYRAVLLQSQVPLAVLTTALNQGHPTPGLGHQGKLLCSSVLSCTQGICPAKNKEMLPLQ